MVKEEFEILLNTVDKVKRFVNSVSAVEGAFDISHGRFLIDAKSIMGIFSLDLTKPVTLIVRSGDVKELENAIQEFLV